MIGRKSAVVSAKRGGKPFPRPGRVFAGPWPKCFVYIFASLILQWAYGLGANIVQSNIVHLTGDFHANLAETTWLVAAYMAPNVSVAIMLIKIRYQFGLRAFAELSILGFVLVCVLQLFVTDLRSALIIRFFAGIAAAPLASLALLYMMEAFAPAKKFTVGLSLNYMNAALAAPLSRLISPDLMENGGFSNLSALEMGLVLISLVCIYTLPLTPVVRSKVIQRLDWISYGLIALGLGLNAVIMSVGILYWWYEAPWIGWGLALAVFSLTIAIIIELNREKPLIDLRWIFSKEMVQSVFILLIFHVFLLERSTLPVGFFKLFGLFNREMAPMYLAVTLGTLLGGAVCVFFLRAGREDYFYLLALGCLALGAYLDSHVNHLTRPRDMMLSQGLVSFSYALFLPPALFKGFVIAGARGPRYVLSFIAVFLLTQVTGGLIGAAFFGSLQFYFAHKNFESLTQNIVVTDPLVSAEMNTLYSPSYDVAIPNGLGGEKGTSILVEKFKLTANIFAYDDVFRLYFYISMVVFVIFLVTMIVKSCSLRKLEK
ncbi:MFS family permease [Bartonella fuyuanensis]|uniref:MFS family permease n=1 Tax=Bartonella fuyuanensis TaxID=1460968 RepID=A0A840E0K4_9HYPH|nr:MFS transporter [Bartonella fuyuanensis]MBB4075748.1 MFS family permease [Bartonella fuyuanensis]